MDNIENYESSVGKTDHAFDHLKKRNGSPGISSSDFEGVITQSENSTTISAGSGYTALVQGIGKERTKIEPKASSGSQMEWNPMEQKYLVCSFVVSSFRFISTLGSGVTGSNAIEVLTFSGFRSLFSNSP